MPAANVNDIEALRRLRAQLIKYFEACSTALSDAESDVHHTLHWLEQDRTYHWKQQIRLRTEAVAKAADALRMKKLYKSPTGARQSTIDEEKALQRAKAALEEAERKAAAVAAHKVRMTREASLFRGAIQKYSTGVHVDVPAAIAQLGAMLNQLETYLNIGPAAPAPTPPAPADITTMARGGPEREHDDGGSRQPGGTGPRDQGTADALGGGAHVVD